MIINFSAASIEMTKSEAAAAGKYGTPEYNDLLDARKSFPNYQIVIKTPKKKADPFKGLTYAYMEAYIQSHDEDGHIMADFQKLRGHSEDGVLLETRSYGEIRMWFLKQYPIFEETRNGITTSLNAIKSERAGHAS